MSERLHEIAPRFRLGPVFAGSLTLSVSGIFNNISFRSSGRRIAGVFPRATGLLGPYRQATQIVTGSRHVKAKSQCGVVAGGVFGRRWMARSE